MDSEMSWTTTAYIRALTFITLEEFTPYLLFLLLLSLIASMIDI